LAFFRQSQIADDFFAFERNVHHFQRRIEELGVIEKRLDRFFIRVLLAGRRRNRPASEGIEAPGANVVGIGLGWVRFLQRLRFAEIPVRDAHKAGSPFVFVGGVNAFKGRFHVGWVEAD
jgi:hypothetical protein